MSCDQACIVCKGDTDSGMTFLSMCWLHLLECREMLCPALQGSLAVFRALVGRMVAHNSLDQMIGREVGMYAIVH